MRFHSNSYAPLRIFHDAISEIERESVMAQSEPPSTPSSSPSRFFRIGRDSHGNWVAQDQHGLCGGLFTSHADALKFAMFETGHRPQAVIMVPDVLKLDMRGARTP